MIPPTAIWLMVAAMAALYIASRSAVAAVVRTWPAPGLRGAAHAAPLAVVAYVAFIAGQPGLALAVCLSTAVASLALVNGIVLVMSPSVRPNTPGQRTWPLAAIAAGILLLSGFSGQLTLLHAVILLLEGVAIYGLWNDPDYQARRLIPADPQNPPKDRHSLAPHWQVLLLVLSLAVSAFGAWAATGAVKSLVEQTRLFTVPLLSAGLVAPMLILPMIGTSGELTHLGRTDEALGTSFALALFSICALVPSLILLHYVKTGASLFRDLREFKPAFDALTGMTYPLSLWRIDTIALLVLGLFYLPAALGKWALTRWEGLALIIAYAAYLAGQAWMVGK